MFNYFYKYKLFLTILPIISLFFNFVYCDNMMDLECKSALLMDFDTGTIIYEKNIHEKLEPASITKIMTMLLTMEALNDERINLNDNVTISKNASKMTTGTRLMMDEGEIRTVEELLYAIAIESANDASIAIAEYICGSEDEFVKKMNEKAKQLGMNDTKFMNSHGLHTEGHITSANNIAIMSRELISYPEIFNYISKYMITINVGKKNDVKRELVNKNKMVRFFQDVDGIKTGFTDNAMYCISVTAKKDNLRLISIIMGSPTTSKRNRDARKLIDYGFANYKNFCIGKQDEIVKGIKVIKGNKEHINTVFEKDFYILIKSGEQKGLEKVLNIPEEICAPIKKGQYLGEIIVKKEGKIIAKQNLISNEEISKASILKSINRAILYLTK